MIYAFTLPLILFVSILFLYAIRRHLRPKPIPGIPHNEITSFLGDIPAISRAKGKLGAVVPYFFEPSAEKLGPIYQVLFGPFSRALVLSDPQEIEELCSRSSKMVDQGLITSRVLAGTIHNSQVALPTNDVWKQQRKAATPSMSTQSLRRMSPRIVANVQGLVNFWSEKMKLAKEVGGKFMDVNQDFLLCTMDTIGDVAIGESFNGISTASQGLHQFRPVVDELGVAAFPHVHGTPLHNACHFLFKRIGGGFMIPSPLLPIYHFFNRYLSAKWRGHYKLITNFIESKVVEFQTKREEIKLVAEDEGGQDSILGTILERRAKQEASGYLDVQMVVDEVLGFVIAGQDSTASVLGFGMKYLTNNPRVQRTLRNELLTRLESPDLRPLTFEDVASADNLPYLEAVIAEILRCAEVGGMVGRRILEDTVILGHAIPKGTDVYLLIGHAGLTDARAVQDSSKTSEKGPTSPSRSSVKPLWGSDVREFRPERWLSYVDDEFGHPQPVFSAKQGVSMPFGVGPRACFGQKLAILELKLFVATLVLNFFFDTVPVELNDFNVLEVLTLSPRDCYVSLKRWEEVDPQ